MPGQTIVVVLVHVGEIQIAKLESVAFKHLAESRKVSSRMDSRLYGLRFKLICR